jgi:hypothetical protein
MAYRWTKGWNTFLRDRILFVTSLLYPILTFLSYPFVARLSSFHH